MTDDDQTRMHQLLCQLPDTPQSMLRLLAEFPQATLQDWWKVFHSVTEWRTPQQRVEELRKRFLQVDGHWQHRNDGSDGHTRRAAGLAEEASFQRYQERRQRLINLRARFDNK